MSSRDLFLGIDGGGTSTDLVLVDADGSPVCGWHGPTSNRSVVGPEAAVAVLRTLIDEALDQIGTTPPIAAGWIGLAGTDRPEDRDLFATALSDRVATIRVTSDAELVLSGNPRGIGIALIGGTGSIAFARNEAGVSGRSGGWGHIFGDEGSAYGIGVDGLRAAAAAVDGRGPPTALTDSLMTHWRATSPQQLVLRVYDPSVRKGDIAASAPIVVDAARNGDPVALQIMELAGAHLGSLVTSLLDRIPFSTPPAVAVTGGLLLNTPELRQYVRRRLVDQPCNDELSLVNDVAKSAALAVRRQITEGIG